LLLGSLVMTSCNTQTIEDYRDEGKGITKNLIKELHQIHSREQLQASSVKLQKLFDNLTRVMIAAQELQQKNPKLDTIELSKEDHELSDRLRFELNRLYNMEGGRAIIEKAQEKSLRRLEAFERTLGTGT
jgi:hypothetical protein